MCSNCLKESCAANVEPYLIFLGVLLQLRYGEVAIKRAVPLALGLISVSNPKLQILDTLSKFSHDSDPEVAHNAILAMGISGAGK